MFELAVPVCNELIKAQRSSDAAVEMAGGSCQSRPPSRLLRFYRYPFHLLLRSRRFRQRHGEDALVERGSDLVLIDVIDRDMALEPAIEALAEATFLVLGLALLLAADRQHAVCEFDCDVLFFETGQFGDNFDFFIRLVDFDAWPAHRLRTECADVKGAKRLIEQAVHFAMHRQKRIALVVERAHVTRAVVPRNEIA